MNLACKAIAALLLASPGSALITSRAHAQEPVFAPTGIGFEMFLVEQPQAHQSKAQLCNDALVSKEGVIAPPTEGFILHARVACFLKHDAAMAEIARSMDGLQVSRESWTGPAGWGLFEFVSLTEAIEAATLLADVYGLEYAFLDVARPTNVRSLPNDPMVPDQWHLSNNAQTPNDINVEPAWNMGITGGGITVGIADNGAEQGHPDLANNFNASASMSAGNSDHGTGCAGLIAAEANNSIGVAGVAYDALWSEQPFGSASTNAATFDFQNQVNLVKSNSWGPLDIGTFYTATMMEMDALQDAVDLGRNGLGTVFTWAGGNGAAVNDRVEYDPYAADRRTIAVGGVDFWDARSPYSEPGSSLMVVAPSDNYIIGLTTTASVSNGSYTHDAGGTSSPAAIVAGIAALILDANPALTWRDVQHVLVNTARKCDISNPEWTVNSAGCWIHYDYGFGAVDAGAAVALAQGWISVGPEYVIDSGLIPIGVTIPDNNSVGVAKDIFMAETLLIEHVEVVMNANHSYVGDLDIRVISPTGTVSQLTEERDDSSDNLYNYVLSSVRHWGENSCGTWRVEVRDLAQWDIGTWNSVQLKIYGHRGGSPTQMDLSVTPLVHGSVGLADVSFGHPTQVTWLAYSLVGPGSTWIPGLGVVLDLQAPRAYGQMQRTDAFGASQWAIGVPAGATGVQFWLQALQAGLVSNVVAGTIQ
ncbi:MAG: S8 family serine peptidase [Planctomycetes bacterium]|nr:S8 family serine peptidase [Planctomycetota bacterium]MCP4770204.1 S8 family serine peptidase [Planctomycetota bacterium]MCP4860648.1 S8 family serine peptidase [Planctomycetota bacterium]